jgi:hypothetical protein
MINFNTELQIPRGAFASIRNLSRLTIETNQITEVYLLINILYSLISIYVLNGKRSIFKMQENFSFIGRAILSGWIF